MHQSGILCRARDEQCEEGEDLIRGRVRVRIRVWVRRAVVFVWC